MAHRDDCLMQCACSLSLVIITGIAVRTYFPTVSLIKDNIQTISKCIATASIFIFIFSNTVRAPMPYSMLIKTSSQPYALPPCHREWYDKTHFGTLSKTRKNINTTHTKDRRMTE
jgi:hypothetical protein